MVWCASAIVSLWQVSRMWLWGHLLSVSLCGVVVLWFDNLFTLSLSLRQGILDHCCYSVVHLTHSLSLCKTHKECYSWSLNDALLQSSTNLGTHADCSCKILTICPFMPVLMFQQSSCETSMTICCLQQYGFVAKLTKRNMQKIFKLSQFSNTFAVCDEIKGNILLSYLLNISQWAIKKKTKWDSKFIVLTSCWTLLLLLALLPPSCWSELVSPTDHDLLYLHCHLSDHSKWLTCNNLFTVFQCKILWTV